MSRFRAAILRLSNRQNIDKATPFLPASSNYAEIHAPVATVEAGIQIPGRVRVALSVAGLIGACEPRFSATLSGSG
jgi:hypothetical protein